MLYRSTWEFNDRVHDPFNDRNDNQNNDPVHIPVDDQFNQSSVVISKCKEEVPCSICEKFIRENQFVVIYAKDGRPCVSQVRLFFHNLSHFFRILIQFAYPCWAKS